MRSTVTHFKRNVPSENSLTLSIDYVKNNATFILPPFLPFFASMYPEGDIYTNINKSPEKAVLKISLVFMHESNSDSLDKRLTLR